MTDFIVLTGFLGSGKTTLLSDFLNLPEAADTAVIVNEVGEIGLDGAILTESSGVPIAMLSNGCICCSLAGDLERTVGALAAARGDGSSLARIVLETSGLSKPGPILRSLAGLAPLRLRVGVVATLDCRAGPEAVAFEEAAAQWAGAQAIVLTKRDIASPEEIGRARHFAASVNPLAELVDSDERITAVRAAFAARGGSASIAPTFAARSHPRIQVLLAHPAATLCWDQLAEWLDDLAGHCGERLLRLKGIVRVADRPAPLLVQSVGTVFSASRPFRTMPGDSPFLVLILRDTDPDELTRIAPTMPIAITPIGAVEKPR